MSTVIEKLRIKGAPAPRNSPASSLFATSRVNRPITSTVITLDKSYEIIFRQANRHSMELAAANMSAAARRMEYLTRLQHANFGISTMDSPFIVCEDTVFEEKPSFVLCGQPVSGVSHKTIDKYLSDQRTGNYKTSAHEMYRVKHNLVKTPKTPKAKSEPSFRISRTPKKKSKSDLGETSSTRSGGNTVPSSAMSRKPTSEEAFELTGKSLKSNSEIDKWSIPPMTTEYLNFKPLKSSAKLMSRQEMTEKIVKDHESGRALLKCIQVNHHNQGSPRITELEENGTSSNQNKAFSQNGLRPFNNPYRHLKHRENVILKDRRTDMKSVRKITKMSNELQLSPNGKHIDLPKNILRVPNPCTDTFLLQMLYTANHPRGSNQRPATGKYSDIALQRDLDEYMVVRTPTSASKTPSGPQIKSPIQKSVPSVKSNADEEEPIPWAGTEIDEDEVDK